MKIAYFAESPADAAAIQALTDGIVGEVTEPVSHNGFRHRGWPSVRTALPSVIKQVHYRTDAIGLVLVVDSNGSRPHDSGHTDQPDLECRLCMLKALAYETLANTTPRTTQPALRVAIGLAIPTIEAWLLCGTDSHVSEAAWINGLKEPRGRMPYSKGDLKRMVYGTAHPSLSLEIEKMSAAAQRLATDLTGLKQLFPQGFGALHSELSSWRSAA